MDNHKAAAIINLTYRNYMSLNATYFRLSLKGNTARQYQTVVIGVISGCRNLYSPADYQPQPVLRLSAQFNPAYHKPWSYKLLVLPIIRPQVKEARIYLD